MFHHRSSSLTCGFCRGWLPALALAAVPACADAGLGLGADRGEPLAEQLSTPVTLGIGATEAGSTARVTAVSLDDDTVREVEIGIRGGALTLLLDEGGELRVESLTAAAADFHVGGSVDMDLTDVGIDLTSPAAAPAKDGPEGSLLVRAAFAIELRWAADLDHGVVDLAPIRLAELPFELLIHQGHEDQVEARLTASQAGTFWTWAGVFELRDLEVDLMGATDQPTLGDDPPVE